LGDAPPRTREGFAFDNSYAAELEGFYVPWKGEPASAPKVVQFNRELAEELGLDPDTLTGDRGAALFAGNETPEGASPLAQAYAGHQFGGFVPQLGDGRALLIGEIIDRAGQRRDLQLKGSGRTPFSRRGDGRAVLGPVLREYLIGEAMHALRIPTTRALAAVTTGEQVMREGLKPGAVLARVATSHIRVGTFQFFAAREDHEKVARLADYTIRRHFPELGDADDRYVGLLRAVRDRQAEVVAKWMAVGFVHGVMNTDNMTVSGETLDYGPCAFIDEYDPAAVFSSIDHGGRYAYGNQPVIAQWNLARLAETLLTLIDPEDTERAVRIATEEVEAFTTVYGRAWAREIDAKLGLTNTEEGDAELGGDLFATMEGQGVDFTALFRALAETLRGKADSARALFQEPQEFDTWLARWTSRLDREPADRATIADAMDAVNPLYIPRNHKVEEALQAAERDGDFGPFQRLLDVVTRPFELRPGQEEYEHGAPDDFGRYVTFCGT